MPRSLVIALTLALVVAPLRGRAQEPAATAAPAVSPPPSTSPSTSGAPGAGSLDFNLFNEQPLTPAEQAAKAAKTAAFEKKVVLRRRMLLAHQAFGFITLATLAATLVIGQLNYDDKYGGGNDTGRFYNAHLGLAIAASGTFATTGALALFAPNPYPKPLRLDPALIHKLSMLMAAIGMTTELVLGPVTASREGHLDQRDLALAHLVVGYATFGFMSAGVLAFVF